MPRSKSRSSSPSLYLGVNPLSESDYFQKSTEFRVWLREEKGKYFDQLTGHQARHYFRKFIKAWNRGNLSKTYYTIDAATEAAQRASSQTAYKWSFASGSKVSQKELKAAREAVGHATYGLDAPNEAAPTSRQTHSTTTPPSRVIGPTFPSASDATLRREEAIEAGKHDRRATNKRDRDRTEDEDGGIGPKRIGREGMLDKKRARRDDDRAMRDRKEDGGLEVREDVLLGAGNNDSFQAAIAKRDAARARWADKRQTESSGGPSNERRDAIKARDAATMAMFQNMAKQRFG